MFNIQLVKSKLNRFKLPLLRGVFYWLGQKTLVCRHDDISNLSPQALKYLAVAKLEFHDRMGESPPIGML